MPVLLSSLFLLASSIAFGPSDSLAVYLLTDRSLYSTHEPINLTLILQNTSAQALTINKRLAYPGPDVMLDIVDSRGWRLRWLPPSPPPPVGPSDFVQLNPGEEFRVRLPDIGRHLFDKPEAGREYRVRAVYRNDDAGSQWHYAAWTGTAESGSITFRLGG